MKLDITTSTLMAQAHPYGSPEGEPPEASMGWVLPTAAKIENVFDMSKYRLSNELSMISVNIMYILTIGIKHI